MGLLAIVFLGILEITCVFASLTWVSEEFPYIRGQISWQKRLKVAAVAGLIFEPIYMCYRREITLIPLVPLGLSQVLILVSSTILIEELLIDIQMSVSRQTMLKWAKAAAPIFLVFFTYYRLATRLMSLLLLAPYSIGRHKLIFWRSKSSCDQNQKCCSSLLKLPEDILLLILLRLHTSDHLRCRAVCLTLQTAVDNYYKETASKSHPPLLMLCSHHLSLEDHCFYSLGDHKIYKSNHRYTKRGDCVGSIDGWLIMVDNPKWRPEGFVTPWSLNLVQEYDHNCVTYFFNPISCARFMLPQQSTMVFKKIVASSVPTSPHCVAAGLCSEGQLAFCRPSTDESWTVIDRDGLKFCDIEIIDGKLYAATRMAFEFLMEFDMCFQDVNSCSTSTSPSYKTRMLVMTRPRPPPPLSLRNRVHHIYLAKDSRSNELFMIYRDNEFVPDWTAVVPWDGIIGHENFALAPMSMGFRVFKLEYSCNVDGPQYRWLEVVDLGDRILFLSEAASTFIYANNSTSPSDLLTRSNCIFYAFDNLCLFGKSRSQGRDFGVFSLTKKSIEHFTIPRSHLRTRLHTRPVWITPNSM